MCGARSSPWWPTTPAPCPQRPGHKVLTAIPGAPTGPVPATLGSAGQHTAHLGLPSAQERAAQRPGAPAASKVVSSTSLSLLRPPPTAGCDLGGLRAQVYAREVQKPSILSPKGPSCTCDAAPFAISAQQTGWLPPFKGRLSPGITADAAGILRRQCPAPGPPKPAGTFKGSEAFISCRRRARPPLPASP